MIFSSSENALTLRGHHRYHGSKDADRLVVEVSLATTALSLVAPTLAVMLKLPAMLRSVVEYYSDQLRVAVALRLRMTAPETVWTVFGQRWS